MQPRVGGVDELPASVARAASNLILDFACARVVSTFERAGIDVILLKGPSIAKWLYERPYDRSYVDVDLLVDPSSVESVVKVLEGMGFEPHFSELPLDQPWYARSFVGPDDVVIEVHRTLPGVLAVPEEAWRTLRRRAEQMEIGGRPVAILDAPGRAMHIVLHAWHHGGSIPHVVDDLSRASTVLDAEVWNRAYRQAIELGAKEAFEEGLQFAPKSLPQSLGVPGRPSRPKDPAVLGVKWFRQLPGRREKRRYLLNKMFPPREFMRAWSPRARRNGAGLVLAYMGRPFWVIGRGVGGLFTLRRTES